MKMNCVKTSRISCSEIENNFKKQTRSLKKQQQKIAILIIFFIIGILVLLPFLVLILKSFGFTILGGTFNVDAYSKIFSDKQTIIALKNTVYVALGVTILASIVGGILAWLVTRTDFPYKKAVKNMVFLTFTIPSYILAISWIEILGRNGYMDRFLQSILSQNNYNFNVYSLEGVIIIMSIHLYPFAFMALSNALKRTDCSLEDAAILSGASRFKTAISITFQLIIPSIISIGLLIFNRTMANFGVAAVIGLPSGREILTTRIYRALNELDLQMAVSISIILVIISGSIFLLNNIFLKKKSFMTITSNSRKPKLIKLGKWKKILVFLVFLFQGCTTIIPLMSIIISSFMKKWGLSIKFENLTFNNYYLLFKNKLAIRAFKNSILYGVLAGLTAVILGTIVSYLSNRTKIKGRKLVEFIATWPMSFPNIVIAVAAILTWINCPLKIYGTSWIIIITYTALFLPIAIKNINGLIQNQDFNLENVGRVYGASRLRAFKDISFPMIVPGIKSGFMISFLIAFREIPISLMLYAQGSETVGVLLFNLRSDSGGLETTSTIAVIIIAITIIGCSIVKQFNKK